MDLAGTNLVALQYLNILNIGDVHDLHIDTCTKRDRFLCYKWLLQGRGNITINANFQNNYDNSNFTVTLSNNEDVVMSVLAGQDTATGNYTVQAGDNEDPLTILTIHSVTDVEDALNNPLQTDLPTDSTWVIRPLLFGHHRPHCVSICRPTNSEWHTSSHINHHTQ